MSSFCKCTTKDWGNGVQYKLKVYHKFLYIFFSQKMYSMKVFQKYMNIKFGFRSKHVKTNMEIIFCFFFIVNKDDIDHKKEDYQTQDH